MLTIVLLLMCVGAGTIGGVFFAFSAFVMRALAQLPASQGVAAMQRINIMVMNPLFLGFFFGTAVLGVGCAVAAFLPWDARRSLWLLAAGLLYVAGTFLVTIAFNVPRNEHLARVDAESPEAAEYWPVYVREWSNWNHLRTVGSLAALGCAVAALAV